MTRPAHQAEALDMLETMAFNAELFAHLDSLMGSICDGLGLENGDLVIGAVRERAKRKARAHLSTLAAQAIHEERDHAAESN